jgi:prepilin-type N-terminal cleavage/methylation domain-containing protein
MPTMFRDPRSRPEIRGGFTLIELIVAIMIIGILTGIAVPVTRSLADTRAGAALRQIERDLTYARERAVATGVLHRVVFDTSAHSYSVVTVTGTDPAGTTTTSVPLPGSGRPFVQALNTGDFQGVTLTTASFNGQSSVTFDWRGVPWAGGTSNWSADGQVTVVGGRTITLRRISGLISPN